jgi:hypothetical protein
METVEILDLFQNPLGPFFDPLQNNFHSDEKRSPDHHFHGWQHLYPHGLSLALQKGKAYQLGSVGDFSNG